MRKVYLFMMISLDGFFEGVNHSLDWHNVDAEFNEFSSEQLDNTGTLLFGRRTYEVMAAYWLTEDAKKDDAVIGAKMNAIPKLVFSETLNTASWEHTTLVSENIGDAVTKLKQEEGTDIGIFGSNNVTMHLIEKGLVDEFRIMINPVILGGGTLFCTGILNRLNLQLLSTKTFTSGNVLLQYVLKK